jgi:hypothetical protein
LLVLGIEGPPGQGLIGTPKKKIVQEVAGKVVGLIFRNIYAHVGGADMIYQIYEETVRLTGNRYNEKA